MRYAVTSFPARCFALAALLVATLITAPAVAQPLKIQIVELGQGDEGWDWTQVRTDVVPGETPLAISTMSRTALKGAHGYHDVYMATSTDHGVNWGKPSRIPTLQRSVQEDGYEVVAGDLWPRFHRQSSTVLLTGKTFNFAGGAKENILREKVAYAVFSPKTSAWGPLKTLELPERDHQNRPIIAPNAGCHQSVHEPDGTILLPIRYQVSATKRNYITIVARCRFDGKTLSYVEHGSEHSLPTRRGLYEPSLVRFKNRYYLTMRADDGAWVSTSDNGLNFSKQIPWRFDDGSPLGSYNTQQHWATIGGGLYLIYTRRAAKNDHIMRHRAPLFIAQVDTTTMRIVRKTEQILVPENNATLGNSGVCFVNQNESWVTVAEGRVSYGPRRGQRNKIFLVKIRAADGSE